MDIGAGANISTIGESAHGVYAHKSSSMDIGMGANISTKGINAHAVYAEDSSVKLGDASISATGVDAYAVLASGDSQITGSGNFQITGSVRNDGSGLLELEMTGNSKITGDLINVSGDGALNVTMDDSSFITGSASADAKVINIEAALLRRMMARILSKQQTAGRSI